MQHVRLLYHLDRIVHVLRTDVDSVGGQGFLIRHLFVVGQQMSHLALWLELHGSLSIF